MLRDVSNHHYVACHFAEQLNLRGIEAWLSKKMY